MANNLFLAAYPGAEDAARIADFAAAWKEKHRFGGTVRKKEILHVTLADLTGLKDRPEAIIDKVSAAATRIAMPAFDVQFDHLQSFSGKPDGRPLVLGGHDGVAGLIALSRALVIALQKEWLKIAANPGFNPHMTLLYSANSTPRQSIVPIQWRVESFALVHSHAGQSRHEILARWPLKAA